MCGFVALFDPRGHLPGADEMERASDVLRHRGPDDSGTHREPGVALAFRRLSIVDLDSGHQPITNEDGSAWIVFNGEIYNHRALRAELTALGHQYRTQSDTESILHAYEEWGDDCVSHLEGMFAFAIWDRPRRRLFAARDHVGIKPLYWTRAGERVLLASEIKSLFAFDGVQRRADPAAVVEHITLRYSAAPRTLFAGIQKLPAGHTLTLDASGERLAPWWRASYEPKWTLRTDEVNRELEQRVTAAVRSHLMSDVPVGALLSGGVDSSIVVALASRELSGPLRTYCVGFESEGEYSESHHARRVAEHCGTAHEDLVVSAATMREAIPRLVWHQDEPLSEPAAIPAYLICALARKSVTVVLTGEGGDELFAGYPKYMADPYVSALARMPRWVRAPLLEGLLPRLPFGLRRLQVAGRSAGFPDEAERLASWFAGFVGEEQRRVLGPWLQPHAAQGVEPFRRALQHSAAVSSMDRMLDADLMTWLPDDLLAKMDKMSMAASVEARVPLLDRPLVEWAMRLPTSFKVRRSEPKALLKDLARRLVPREVVDRPKVGFTVPLSPWFRGPLKPMLQEVLLDRRCLERGHLAAPVVRQLVSDHIERRRDHSRELWTLLSLELWFQRFIDAPASPWLQADADEVAVRARA